MTETTATPATTNDENIREYPILKNFIEVTLANREDFLKVKETLERIGFASRAQNVLYQSCHILHKRGRYYITHFKEMFMLDGKPTDFTDNDIARRNSIARLLQEWNLVKIVNPEMMTTFAPMSEIKVVHYKDKANWRLVSKYTVGAGRRYAQT